MIFDIFNKFRATKSQIIEPIVIDKVEPNVEPVKKIQLSKNFVLSEFTKSDVAQQMGIDNTPNESQLNNITELCNNFLQPLRDKLNTPIIISSGFRCPELNTKIGGKNTSQHIANNGAAIDINVKTMPAYELALYIKDNFNFDQLIYEIKENVKTKNRTTWVHVSWKNTTNNRNECLTIKNGSTRLGILPL